MESKKNQIVAADFGLPEYESTESTEFSVKIEKAVRFLTNRYNIGPDIAKQIIQAQLRCLREEERWTKI